MEEVERRVVIMTEEQFYEWLSGFEFLQRTLDRMQQDIEAVNSGATEMLRSFLQKEWEQAEKVFRL
jgi:hypothetical protein